MPKPPGTRRGWTAVVGFGRTRPPVSVSTAGRDDKWKAEKADLTSSTKTDGHPAWYDTGRNPLSRGSAGSSLVVETEHCVIRLTAADRGRVSRADLDAIVAGMAIGDCDDTDTWIAPLS